MHTAISNVKVEDLAKGNGDESQRTKELFKDAGCHVHLAVARAGVQQRSSRYAVWLYAQSRHLCQLQHGFPRLASPSQLHGTGIQDYEIDCCQDPNESFGGYYTAVATVPKGCRRAPAVRFRTSKFDVLSTLGAWVVLLTGCLTTPAAGLHRAVMHIISDTSDMQYILLHHCLAH